MSAPDASSKSENWDRLRELAAKVAAGPAAALDLDELSYVRTTCEQLGFQSGDVEARMLTPEGVRQLVLDARERVSGGSKRLMAAIVASSPELLRECLFDPVPLYRKVAAVELSKLGFKM
jgi:hypothetical protein